MLLYVVTWVDESEGKCLAWYDSIQEAEFKHDLLCGEGKQSIEIGSTKDPARKAQLVEWLNKVLQQGLC